MSANRNTSRWTFRKYLTEVYIPQKQLRTGLKPSTVQWLQHLVKKLEECRGRGVRLRELDDSALEEFEVWSVRQGCTANTARDRRHQVKAVLRHWRPDEHPPRQGQPSWQFAEADVKGSLEQI